MQLHTSPKTSQQIRKLLDVLTPGLLAKADVAELSVSRTVDRKGYRHGLPYLNNSPYKDCDPKTHVLISFEIDDDATPEFKELVADIIEIERGDRDAKAALRKMEKAQEALEAAKREYERAQRAATKSDPVVGSVHN